MIGWLVSLIESAFSTAIVSFFVMIAEGAIDFVIGLFGEIYGITFNITEYPVVKNLTAMSMTIGFSLIAVKVIYDTIVTYQLRITGDPNSNPGGLLVRATISIALIFSLPLILSTIFKLTTYLVKGIESIDGLKNVINGEGMNIIGAGGALQGLLFTLASLVIVGIIMLFITLIQVGMRSSEMAMVVILAPIMASMFGTGLFKEWWNHLLRLCITHVIQLIMLKITFYLLIHSWALGEYTPYIIFLGGLAVTIKSPKIAEKYIDSTGVGGAITGTTKTAGTMYFMRKALARGM
jgi:hypothetical protein